MRQDRGDAGMDILAFLDRDMAHLDPVNIGDAIEWAGRQDADNDTGFARTFDRGRGGCRRQKAKCHDRLAQYHRCLFRLAPVTVKSILPSDVFGEDSSQTWII